jgi:IS30 family transposase
MTRSTSWKPPTRALEREFWRHIGTGLPPYRAADAAGVSRVLANRWYRDGGGMTPTHVLAPATRYLSLFEREEIAVGLARGESLRAIARRLHRSPSTISRELVRNKLPGGCPRRAPSHYRAAAAQAACQARARRPKTTKLAAHPPLQSWVQSKLEENWSPEQIARRAPILFPDDERMRVSHETIYQALYVQGRGELRRELAKCLRTGRALRKPNRRAATRHAVLKDMVMITERPPEIADRAIPGHWEGDLILGRDRASAIGTLVERSTRFTMLLHLPDKTAPTVRDAIATTITALPVQLRRSLTWDQGSEMAQHVQLRLDTEMAVYFCDPHSPWQRGTNENTNGLLRQYFPKGTDLSVHTPEHLAHVAAQLNARPRKTLGWATPAETLNRLLSDELTHRVAKTP